MIPKKIHYTWFSNDPFPDRIKECMESWHKTMPDFEFVHWDMDRIASIDSTFLKEALQSSKWAFAADFVRLWALFHEGGIYLDTDVMVFRSFEPLLHNRCFIGKENSRHIHSQLVEEYLTSHCMGAEAGHPFIKECLHYYDGRHFILSRNNTLPESLRLDITLLPFIQSEIAKQWKYNPNPSADSTQFLQDGLTIYPKECFDCIHMKNNSYCRHLAVGSWRSTKRTQKKITLTYKIKWRLEYIMKKLLDDFGYIVINKT